MPEVRRAARGYGRQRMNPVSPVDRDGRLLRTRTRETLSGFCSKCGIWREDCEGVPVTDCVCTAKMKHKEECRYVRAVSMPVSIAQCDPHGLDACEECDCDCGYRPEPA